ncbi:MAG: VWA domain-containing protein [Planctomycetes bacterium]|nr:VWA domain-containing protein [Planctomycetota bacterium]MCB9903546.1 VWA domain-containing protein [Planctomycetota bacterium]
MSQLLGFDLLRPAWTVAMLAAPLLLAAGVFGLVLRRRELLRWADARRVQRLFPGLSLGRARLRVVLAAIALLLGAFALTGPVRGYSLQEVERAGHDVVVVVDTSRSMLVQDVRPDRLTRAKREVRGLLQRLEGDRVGLLAFAGDVREVAPLTHDRRTLEQFVDTLSPRDNLVGGTNIGAALERAVSLFDGRSGAHEAIVLITDGEDLEGHGLEVARTAADKGIRVYVVGMGTEAGGKIPDEQRGFVRDETGSEVVSTLDGSTLRQIAEATGGDYLSISDAVLPLEELYEKRITKLDTRELWAGKLRVPHDRFQWPLVLALGCMLLESGLRERRSTRRRAGGDA